MSKPQLLGVIFDMDGLIFDSEMVYYEASQLVANEMGIPYSKDVYMRYIGLSDDEMCAGYHAQYDDTFGEEAVQRFIDAIYDRSLELFEQGHAPLKSGVHELLDFLKEKNIPTAIASSNSRKIIEILLDTADLSNSFDTIISFDDVTFAKPDPEIFNKAQEKLNVPKENLLVLEDSFNGIRAAVKAQIPVIMVPDLIAPNDTAKQDVVDILPSLIDVRDKMNYYYEI